MTQAFGYLARALALALLGCVLLGYGGALVFALEGLAHFRLHFLLMIPAVAVLALATRQWTALLRLGTAALLAVVGLGPVWEQAGPTPAEGFPITVMTANLSNKNTRLAEARAALLAEDVDVLVTQETTKAMQVGETSLARHYPYRLALNTSGQILRTVLWSKYPMRGGELMLEDSVEPTGAMAQLDLGEGREILVMGLHMAHSVFGNQEAQIAALGGLLRDRPHPRVLLGDFNATPWSRALAQIQSISGTRRPPGYRITWRGAYPSPLGAIRAPIGQPIDHILASPDVGIGEVRTLEMPGSDHLALRATLWVP